uniref:Uncharacterized protein n=1 Tax=viral metagenome TaxID=1070528 RepID=A0A6C0JH40_9ZZZZ
METLPLNVIIVEKNGLLKMLSIKDFREEELFKKCGFKKADDFTKQTQWNIKLSGTKYIVEVYAKTEGRANSENKYDFPPPIDTKLFFGNCVIISKKQDLSDEGKFKYTNLSLDLWEKMYEKLFGGFEDLTMTAIEDENEIDELENIPKEKKTKDGYLKDGFVVDSSDTEDEKFASDADDDDDDDEANTNEDDSDEIDGEDDLELELLGSELSEDDYEYDTTTDDEEGEGSEESEKNEQES